MSDEYWDRMDNEEMDGYEPVMGDTGIYVNGSFREIDPGTSFKQTVASYAEDAGFGKFRVFLNGSEIKPNEAPETFNEGTKVELRPFEVAG